MARQDCTAGVAAAELPLGLQHSPCGAQEGVVVDRLAVAAERPGSRQRRHSRDDDGDGKASREKQVRFRVDGDRVVDPKVVDGLRHALTTRHAVLAAAAGVRDVKANGGLNVEGLELSADQQRLWIGFRSPLHDGRALIACVENPAAVFQSDEAPRMACARRTSAAPSASWSSATAETGNPDGLLAIFCRTRSNCRPQLDRSAAGVLAVPGGGLPQP